VPDDEGLYQPMAIQSFLRSRPFRAQIAGVPAHLAGGAD